MTLLNLGTYPPKQCGIATFNDLRNSLSLQGNQGRLWPYQIKLSYFIGGFIFLLARKRLKFFLILGQSKNRDYKKAAAFYKLRTKYSVSDNPA